MEKADYIVIGAGIVGLASAYQILKKNNNLKLFVLDKESSIASHQTGKNSGVIHSGLYYKPGSLKANNCYEGRKMLFEFLDENSIKYDKCGKVIIATNEKELPRLFDLEKRSQANKVEGIKVLSKEELKEIEPHIEAIKALKVASCSIVDFLKVAEKLKEKIEQMGGKVILDQEVKNIKKEKDTIIIVTTKDTFLCKNLINCAGLYSDKIAKMGLKEKINVKIVPFRGEYYDIVEEKKNLIKALVYPVPDPQFPFLGVHLTKNIYEHVHVGPNAVLAFARQGYKKSDVNLKELLEILFYKGFIKVGLKYWKMGLFEMYRSFSKKAFLKSVQKMLPVIEMKDLKKGSAGIRAQAVDKTGKLLDDFSIIKNENQVHVLNAPSPAATASLAIGKHIANLALEN
jgi:(S)-2-hydroxyglutarate dehydrogenase